MKKRLLAILVLLVLAVFALTSCNLFFSPEKPTYEVTFDTDGGSAVEAQVITRKEPVIKPEEPTKEGHTFAGWYADEALSEAWDFENNLILEATTIYAKWSLNSHTVDFVGSEDENQTVDWNTTTTKPADPTKVGHTFGGWYADEEFQTEFDFTKPIKGDTTVYAKWSINSYTVSFDAEGVASQTVQFGSLATKPTDPTRTGYTFRGWLLGGAAFDFATPITESISLSANWEINKYTITYTDGVDGETVFENEVFENVPYGSATPTIAEPTRQGYQFNGWDIDVADTVSGDVTYTASWVLVHEHSYTVKNTSAKYLKTAATCTESAVYYYSCNQCIAKGAETFQHGAPLGHDMGAWTETKAPTCTEDGSEKRDCSRCDHSETRDVEALKHSFTTYVYNDDATCTADGTETAKCDRCTVTDTRTKANTKLDHTYNTTEKNDTHHWTKCSCGATTTKVAHDFGDWTYEEDEHTRSCEICSATETRDDHIYTSVTTNPTCTEPGKTVKTCICGHSEEETLPAKGHNKGENDVCTGCEMKIVEVAANKTIAELITSEGWTSSTTKQEFNLDNNVKVKVDGGNNSGKAYNNDHIRIYATDSPAGTLTISVPEGCTIVSITISAETGTYAFLCIDGTETDICNETTNVSGSTVVLKSVKNGSDGKQIRVTAITVVYEVAECNGEHQWNEGTVTKEPSCTETGVKLFTCDECGKKMEETLSTVSHTAEKTDAVAPKCETAGHKAYWQCSECESYFADEACTVKIEDIDAWKAEGGAGYITATGHTVTSQGKKEANCTESGYAEYWFCDDCDTYFSDADCTVKIADLDAWKAEGGAGYIAASHIDENNDYVCDRCSENICKHTGGTANCKQGAICTKCDREYGSTNPSNHVNTITDNGTSATCTGVGYTAGTQCDDCKVWISGHEEIPTIAHKNKAHHAKVDATCVATGTIEYWSCPDCIKNFSDETCTTEVTDLTIAIDSTNHVHTTAHEQTNATCTEVGYTAGTYCENCKTWISGHEEIKALGHKDEDDDYACDNSCGKYIVVTSVTIADYASANNWVNDDKTQYSVVQIGQNISVTASSTGSYTGKYNDEWRIYQTDKGKITFTSSNNVTIISIKITYNLKNGGILIVNGENKTSNSEITVSGTSITLSAGSSTGKTNGQVRITAIEVAYVVDEMPTNTVTINYVDEKGNKIGESKTIEVATDSNFDFNNNIASIDNYTFQKWLNFEGEEIDGSIKINSDITVTAVYNHNHSFTNYKSDGNATCEADGTKTAKCDRCDETDTVADEDSATGHTYGEVSYNWNVDYTECTATRACTVCNNHTETATATSDSVTVDATCKAEGSTTYTAEFEENWAEMQIKVAEIDKLPHSHDESKWVNNTESHWHECTVCGDKKDEADHISGGAATEENPEKCTVCGYVIAPALGHIHTNHLTAIGANDATCTEPGNTAYWSCSCGKYFSDENAGKEIAENSWVISAKNHAYGEATYTWSEDGKSCTATRICANDAKHTETANAVITSAVTTPATCTVMGTTTYTATFDVDWAKDQTTDVQNIAVIAHTYNQQNTADTYKASSATCIAKATYYYSCSCGAKGTTTFEHGSALGHSADKEGDKAATCNSLAYCSVCKQYYGEKNLNNHASEGTYYSGTGENHKKYHSCCNVEITTTHQLGSWSQISSESTEKQHSRTCSCDYVETGDCTDSNKDHACDTCGNKTSDCTASDTACAVCGKKRGTVSFATADQRTEQDGEHQVWTNNQFTVTNNRNGAQSSVVGDFNPVKFYAGSQVIIVADGNMTKIVFNCNKASYATALKDSIGDAATANDKVVTVTLDGTSNTFTVAELTAQVRVDSIEISYVPYPEYTVSFDTNGGSAIESQTVVQGNKVTEPSTAPTMEGFIFSGWYKDAECTEDNEWNFGTDTVTGDTTIYAKWEEVVVLDYDVIFKVDGETYETQTVTSPAAATVPGSTPTKDGYIFRGWYLGDAEYDFSTPVTSNITLEAKWICTIENALTLEDGTEVVVAGFVVVEGTNAKIFMDGYSIDVDDLSATYTKHSYVIITGTISKVDGVNKIDEISASVMDKNVQPTLHTVTFVRNNGSTTTDTVVSGYVVSQPGTPNKKGHTFDGWYADEGLNTEYVFSTPVKGDISIYAKWTINQYTITFDTDGGSTVDSITANYGSTITAPTDLTKDGYTFAGWSPALPSTMPAENMTVKALWTSNSGSGEGGDDTVVTNTVTMAYPGGTTTNWNDSEHNASTFGLDTTIFTVTAVKGSASNHIGLNTAGDFRLYYNASGGNEITVNSSKTITTIALTATGTSYSNFAIYVDGNTVSKNDDGSYTINANSFTIKNANTSNVQVRIKSVEITYVVSVESGGTTEPEHTCESVCGTCGGCTDGACTEDACAEKCEEHEAAGETTTVTMSYSGSTTNMSATDTVSNAKKVNLDSSIFTVKSTLNDASTHVGLNQAGNIRLYSKKSSSNGAAMTITISENYRITSITITLASSTGTETYTVSVNNVEVDANDDGSFTINSNSFTIQNTNANSSSSNPQLHIQSIEITYTSS